MKLFIIATLAEADRLQREALAAGLEPVLFLPGGDLRASLLAAGPDLVLLDPSSLAPDLALAVATVTAAMSAPVPLVLLAEPAEADRLRAQGAEVLSRPVTDRSLRTAVRAKAGLEVSSREGGGTGSPPAGWPLWARMADFIDATFDEELWATARRDPTDPARETPGDEVGASDVDDERVRAAYALVEEGDYFRVLGVPREASAEDIADAHATLRAAFDAETLAPAIVTKYKNELVAIREVLAEAWLVLGDEDRRRRYLAALAPAAPDALASRQGEGRP